MHFTPILMKGAMYWMDLTVEKRTLGNNYYIKVTGCLCVCLFHPHPNDWCYVLDGFNSGEKRTLGKI